MVLIEMMNDHDRFMIREKLFYYQPLILALPKADT